MHNSPVLNHPLPQSTLYNWRTRPLWHRICIVGLILCVATGSIAYAGYSFQGTELQGTTLIDMTQANSILQGSEFTATSLSGEIVTVIDFRGALADVVTHGTGRESSQTAVWTASQLVGLEWFEPSCTPTECIDIRFRIHDIEIDDSFNTMIEFSDNSDIALFRVQYTESGMLDDWRNVCANGNKGLFLNGRWTVDGSYNPTGYTFACQDGVIAKCARDWGYKPWRSIELADGTDVNLQPLHQACTRAARADYCGDGAAHTVEDTLIDIFDVYGLNVQGNNTTFSEEAAFGVHGAVDVTRPRFPRGADGNSSPMTWNPGLICQPRPSNDHTLVYVWSLDPSN